MIRDDKRSRSNSLTEKSCPNPLLLLPFGWSCSCQPERSLLSQFISVWWWKVIHFLFSATFVHCIPVIQKSSHDQNQHKGKNGSVWLREARAPTFLVAANCDTGPAKLVSHTLLGKTLVTLKTDWLWVCFLSTFILCSPFCQDCWSDLPILK